MQNYVFQMEIRCLIDKRPLTNSSEFLNLNMFLEKDELLWIGGRLKFSNISESQKHQKLLLKPYSSTELLIKYYIKVSIFGHSDNSLFIKAFIPGQNQVRLIINSRMTSSNKLSDYLTNDV